MSATSSLKGTSVVAHSAVSSNHISQLHMLLVPVPGSKQAHRDGAMRWWCVTILLVSSKLEKKSRLPGIFRRHQLVGGCLDLIG